MTARQRVWVAGLGGLFLAVALPVAAYWARHRERAACALDGGGIVSDYRVEIIDADGKPHEFCCLSCAQLWLKNEKPAPLSIKVVDEVSGQSLDAASAWYVRSSVVTTPATGNRIHVFRNRADAERHADRFGGRVLAASENPLRW